MSKKLWYMLVITVAIMASSGCSGAEKPEDVFKTFTTNWENKRYEDMYAMLSKNSKFGMTLNDFKIRLESIYKGITLSKIDIKPVIPQELKPDSDGNIKIPFIVTMDTEAGLVKFTHEAVLFREEGSKDKWSVLWDENMIFPGLDRDDSINTVEIIPDRGRLLDRSGKILATSIKAVEVGIVPKNLGAEANRTKIRIHSMLGIEIEDIDNRLKESWVEQDSFVPVKIIDEGDNSIQDLIKVQGVAIRNVTVRYYPYKDSAAHLIGYAEIINHDELTKNKITVYGENDIIGRTGLEQAFEKRLRGEKGWIIQIADSRGNVKREIARKEPKRGEDIRLTIDIELQETLYKNLKYDSGTAVLLDPKTGELLALVSAPSYDPNPLAADVGTKKLEKLNSDPDLNKPLLNRFTCAYAPGSALMPIIAAIGLDLGVINLKQYTGIEGLKWQKDNSWGNYFITRLSDPKKAINLKDALMLSDNIYFAQAALNIGSEMLLKESRKLGVGEDLSVDFNVEPSQLTVGEVFQSDIQIADSGCGQGQVTINPIHMSLMYTIFLNGGDMIAPRIEYSDANPKVWHEKVVSRKTVDTILGYLIEDAKSLNISGKNLVGKIGTSKMVKYKTDAGTENGWAIVFDTENPNMLVTMMVEDINQKGGSKYLIPKIKDIFKRFGK